MDRAEAAMKLSTHLMQCGMMMPVEWVEKNGEGSELMEAFQMAIAALREQEQRWVSVEERLPEGLESCLVVVKQKYNWEKTYRISTDYADYQPFGDGYIDGCWDTCNDWDEGEEYIHVTHWMPLPEPPKEGAEG